MRNSGAVVVAVLFSIFLSARGHSDEGNDLTGGSGPHHAYLRTADGRFQDIRYTEIGGLAIAQSDIVLGTHAAVQQQTASNLAKHLGALDYKALKQKPPELDHLKIELPEITSPFAWVHPLNTDAHQLWPRGRIPYIVDASITDPTLKAAINDAVEDWNRLGIVRIEPASPSESTRPLTIYSTSVRNMDVNVFRCVTYIGYDTRPPDTDNSGNHMYLSNKCTKGSIVHEIGHALGLRHEHARTNREAFMSVDTTSIMKDKRHNFDEQDGQSLGLSYDPCSIMHYSDTVSRNWTTTGRPETWFTLKEPGKRALNECRQQMSQTCGQVVPGQRCELSPSDIETIRRLYQ
jgi:Astacin (Peptidase family M12A)